MKTGIINKSKISFILGMMLITVVSCEREVINSTPLATFPDNPEVYIDGFSPGLEYLPYGDSVLNAFSVDTETKYDGSSAMRFDVPNVGDPLGAYAGAIFPDYGGRDLTRYDALTFWAKGTRAGTVNSIGFGQDFLGNKFEVSIGNLQLTTNWRKYVVPIPDPSVLTQAQGLFWYAEGPENGEGYSFWVDELQYESLGTFANPRAQMLLGQDQVQQTFTGAILPIGGLTYTVGQANGIDLTVAAAPGYFEFTSSNENVATVDEFGVVNVVGTGGATITATMGGEDAEGSLNIVSLGDFTQAPEPPARDPQNVISIFSDSYDNVPVDYYNGFFTPDGQTTQGGAPPLNFGDGEVINYTDLNFVGIGTFLNVAPVDATSMTHFHVDINVQENLDPGDFIRLVILNDVGGNETSGSVTLNSSQLVSNGWGSYDIPLGEFTGLGGRDKLGLIFFVSDATISDIYVDNIYYYKEVVDPSPNVDDSAATEVALPVGFESTTLNYNFLGFEGADSAIEANPDPTGINPTATLMRSTKTPGAQFFAGTLLNLDAPIDFSSSQKFRMKVWSPKNGIPIRVRLEDQNNTAGIELDANTTTSNEWEELEWDFSGVYNPGVDYVRIVVFFEFIPGLPGDGSTYYYDDIQIVD